MAVKKIDADLLKRMFLSGAKNLELNKEWINELNVFPVPDGDTGTNMTMTIMSAAREVQGLETPDDGNTCKSDFIRFFKGSQRQLRRNPVSAVKRFHERD